MQFLIGQTYRRLTIAAEFGGREQTYMPTVGRRIVAVCVKPDANPGAPGVILCGSGPEIARNGERLAAQGGSVPVFTKQAVNEWRYEGRFEVVGELSSAKEIRRYAVPARRSDVSRVLLLEPVADVDAADFEQRVEDARRSTADARRERLAVAPRAPKVRYELVKVYERNPDVVAEVLEQAKGVCQECRSVGPFKRRSNGAPYLEVHHRLLLADGGDDTVANAVALCPNCHRKVHYG